MLFYSFDVLHVVANNKIKKWRSSFHLKKSLKVEWEPEPEPSRSCATKGSDCLPPFSTPVAQCSLPQLAVADPGSAKGFFLLKERFSFPLMPSAAKRRSFHFGVFFLIL